jgi:hypothetical protein
MISLLPLSGRQKKDLCVLSEAGGGKVIEITRSNSTAQMEFF